MQAHSTSTQKCTRIGTITGAVSGITFVIISALIAYFVVEPNMSTVTHGILRIVNFFHPLNPTILASSAITITGCTILGALIGFVVGKYIHKH